MASGLRLREAGARKSKRGSLSGRSLGVHLTDVGEQRLNLPQVHALEQLFVSSPAVQAARRVLCGQLLSGGLTLKKEGVDVELTAEFKRHLAEEWLPFAEQVIDSLLKWGYVVIAYEEVQDNSRRLGLIAKRRAVEAEAAAGKKKSKATQAVQAAPRNNPPVLVPIVPTLGTYEVAWTMTGRCGYRRKYMVYTNSSGHGTREDEEARVVVKKHPDSVGNCCSALASVFDAGSFISVLNELAVTAESSRARPRLVTQMRKKDANELSPDNMFFDSASRAVQASADTDDNESGARALAMQQLLCRVLNETQTRSRGPDHDTGSFSNPGSQMGPGTKAPPDPPPQLFHLPKNHESAPHLVAPESRGDLEALTRLAQEQICAAFGLSADLVFTGRFASKSTTQLALLNTTVSELATTASSVLTLAYRDLYGEETEDVGELVLVTSPLAATEEVLALYAGGLLPMEVAMSASMHAIGATRDTIANAIEEASREEKEKKTSDTEARQHTAVDHATNLQERKLSMEKVKAETEAVRKGHTEKLEPNA